MKRAFISGHTDLTTDEFIQHYQSKIDAAILAGHDFIMGSAPGADTMAREYLVSKGYVQRLVVYLFERNITNLTAAESYCQTHNVPIFTGFSSYTSRDAEMTRVSDYDIAWVRPLEESIKKYGDKFDSKRVSGTQKNLDRRARIRK